VAGAIIPLILSVGILLLAWAVSMGAGLPEPGTEAYKKFFQSLKAEIVVSHYGNTWTYEVKNLTSGKDAATIGIFQIEGRDWPVNRFDESGRKIGVFSGGAPYGWEGGMAEQSVYWYAKEPGAEIAPGQSLTFRIVVGDDAATWKSTTGCATDVMKAKVSPPCKAVAMAQGFLRGRPSVETGLIYITPIEGPEAVKE